jgi:hypothetical protein
MLSSQTTASASLVEEVTHTVGIHDGQHYFSMDDWGHDHPGRR